MKQYILIKALPFIPVGTVLDHTENDYVGDLWFLPMVYGSGISAMWGVEQINRLIADGWVKEETV